MKSLALATLIAASLTTAVNAQTVIEPVRYQYGQYNEVFYGGGNPSLNNSPYVYLPPALQPAYSSRRQNTPIYPGNTPYQPYGPGTPFFSPYSAYSNVHTTTPPIIYSDYLPMEEVGQFGFTIDSARNEAYSRVPRIQYGAQRVTPEMVNPPAEPVKQTASASNPRLKAIPLLDWAKNERAKNPQLYKALLHEAKKYDPDRVARFESDVASER